MKIQLTKTYGKALPGMGANQIGFEVQGLELRDLFAMAAISGLLADSNVTGTPDDIAKASYGIADAMLKAK